MIHTEIIQVRVSKAVLAKLESAQSHAQLLSREKAATIILTDWASGKLRYRQIEGPDESPASPTP